MKELNPSVYPIDRAARLVKGAILADRIQETTGNGNRLIVESERNNQAIKEYVLYRSGLPETEQKEIPRLRLDAAWGSK